MFFHDFWTKDGKCDSTKCSPHWIFSPSLSLPSPPAHTPPLATHTQNMSTKNSILNPPWKSSTHGLSLALYTSSQMMSCYCKAVQETGEWVWGWDRLEVKITPGPGFLNLSPASLIYRMRMWHLLPRYGEEFRDTIYVSDISIYWVLFLSSLFPLPTIKSSSFSGHKEVTPWNPLLAEVSR